jgi:3',5'-cyclic AMP phosphodiesterase CpdA
LTALIVAVAVSAGLAAPRGQLPGRADSLKLAVIGDNGNGSKEQYEVGARMAEVRRTFPFEMVLMMGDNMYGSQNPADFVAKFEKPYAALLQAGVPFFAALGNHDNPTNRNYAGFGMGGQRYYTYVRRNARFVVLDTNAMDQTQLGWFNDVLEDATEDWKIVYFHHPLYSDGGRHGSDVELRVELEPILVRHGVQVVLSGHEHFYERIKPQKGITYFIAGSGGQLRKGDINTSAMTAAGFDQDRAFMLIEIAGDEFYFQTISRTGQTVDAGVISRRPVSE